MCTELTWKLQTYMTASTISLENSVPAGAPGSSYTPKSARSAPYFPTKAASRWRQLHFLSGHGSPHRDPAPSRTHSQRPPMLDGTVHHVEGDMGTKRVYRTAINTFGVWVSLGRKTHPALGEQCKTHSRRAAGSDFLQYEEKVLRGTCTTHL